MSPQPPSFMCKEILILFREAGGSSHVSSPENGEFPFQQPWSSGEEEPAVTGGSD